jgi:ribose transport system permease protein
MTMDTPTTTEAVAAVVPDARTSRWRDLVHTVLSRYSLVLILLAVVVVFSILEPVTFGNPFTAVIILQQEAVLACLAIGLLFPLAVGEFDLSVGFLLGLSAVLATAIGDRTDLPDAAVILIVLLIGAAAGALNGVLVSVFGVGSLVATLGVGFGLSGLTIGVSGSQTLFEGIPEAVTSMANTPILGVNSSVWVVGVVAVIAYVLLTRTPFGRQVYAIGSSERVARLAGVRTRFVKIMAFAIAGLASSLAGLIQLGQAGAANPGFGVNLLLPCFAAVFLGATAIRTGFFNVWGTVVAILLLAAGFTGLSLMGVPLWVEPIFNGLALLSAVLFARGARRRSRA